MNKQNLLKITFVTFLLFFSVVKMQAQTGTIQGVITDENGLYVPGANVYIDALKKGTTSNFDGKFTLVKVPEGNQNIRISYIGYKDVIKQVTVKSGRTDFITVQFKEESVFLDEIKITTALKGQAKALSKQKNNLNITNVVSTDQIGKFPDSNIGDAVKRISGITMQVDQGEARNIIVRGLSPQLNSVTLNGSRVPSAEGDNRNIQMDLIPSDMIQTIEVSKAVTPDMDGDALGGSVNLVTRTAPRGFRFSATAGSGVNFITNKRILNGSLLVGDRSENEKFGWMFSASINDNDYASHNIEAEWDNAFEYNTGVKDANGDDILKEIDVNPYTNEFQQRNYFVQRIRRSFAANFDYNITPNNTIFLKTMYNWRDDRENRFRTKYKIRKAKKIDVGDFTITNNTPINFPVDASKETKGGINNDRNKNRRLEDQRMQNYTLGGNHLFGSVKVDWMASYAKASEERLNERYAAFKGNYIISNDNTDPKFPIYRAKKASDATDLSNYEYDGITEENKYTDEKDFNTLVNFEIPSDFFGNGDGFIKLGFKTRAKEKKRDNNFFEFDLETNYPTLDKATTKDYTNPDFLAGKKYAAGKFATAEWLGNLNLVNGDDVPKEYLRKNFTVKESVTSGYVMAKQMLSENVSFIAGLRLENTDLTAVGNKILDEGNLVGKITKKTSYTNVLPAVHLKYNLSKNSIIRAAWTNTIARPNYSDIVPSLDVITGDEEIFEGNPDLDPTTSMNFDVSAEHYFKNVGLISGGFFYKQIDKFIYTYKTKTKDNSYGTGTNGFDLFKPLNGDDASVLGVEIAFQRQLSFLPSFLKNLSLYANYTYLTSNANGIRNEDGKERDDVNLPNTSPNMFNSSLGYDDGKFTARISANFSDAYLDEVGKKAFSDRYYDKQFLVDFNVGYTINKNLRIYADLTNLTNQPLRYYQGISDRTMQTEYYGRRLTFGLKYDLFKK